MNKSKKKNLALRLFKASLPTIGDLSALIKILIVVIIGMSGLFLFNYTSTANAATSEGLPLNNGLDGIFRGVSMMAADCVPEYYNPRSTSGFVETIATGDIQSQTCSQEAQSAAKQTTTPGQGFLAPINYGPTGRVINGTADLQDTDIAQPGLDVEYYANKLTGKTFAADNPTTGRSVLAPVLFLNNAMVNLAYALIVIILILSSLSILIGTLTGGEERVTLVQLLINTGVTLVMITMFYEIAAIIYDLTVNYGNALVASVLSPYINAKVILERLEPGGDLSIVAVLNTFQFVGVSDSLLVVTKSITAGLYPALAQSSIAINRTIAGKGNVPNNPIAGIAGFGGGLASIGISSVVSSFLGNKEVFDAIISWTIFILNLRIFVNLLSAFVTFTVYVGFGPLMMLNGVSGGFEKISETFKTLIAYGLVFPVTFFFILLGAITMNMFIRSDPTENGVSKSVLCTYSTADPANTSDGVIDRSGIDESLVWLTGGDTTKSDPGEFRTVNYLNQRIFDTTPVSTKDGVRDCRPSLFPLPWTFVPAPFGTIGQRQLQIQTIDALVRTFMGVAFLILASRAPAIIKELLEIKEMGALKGLQGAFGSGLQSFFGVGSAALSIGLPLAAKVTGGIVGRASKGVIGKRGGSAVSAISGFLTRRAGRGTLLSPVRSAFNQLNAQLSRNKKGSKKTTLGDAFSILTTGNAAAQNRLARIGYGKQVGQLTAAGVDPATASMVGAQQLAANYDKIAKQLNSFGQAVTSATTVLTELTKSAGEFSKQLQQLVSLSLFED